MVRSSPPVRFLVAATALSTIIGAGATGSPAGAVPPTDRAAGVSPQVANPYAGGVGYVNPLWKARADAEPGGARVSNTPTAVWLESIAAVTGDGRPGSMRLSDHLDTAVAQGASYIQLVLHNLPSRDCDREYSPGELGAGEIDRYRHEYVDPIAATLADPRYAHLKIVTIVEPNSLDRLVTSTGGRFWATERCEIVKANGAYVDGIRYALGALHAIPHVYTYLDVAHHGEIGWPDTFGPVADLMASTVRGAAGGMASVDGIVANTANYSVLAEKFFTANTMINGQSVRQTRWVDWNDYVDVNSFVAAFRQRLISLGFGPRLGVLIDTSRNGWGGPHRPTTASVSNDLNTFVDASRFDRRIQAAYWCNQQGAGLGERPTANPTPDVDAYVWIKPPGESDGSAADVYGFGMCHRVLWSGGNDRLTGTIPNAPGYGAWFPVQFQELMRNAYPPLPITNARR